MMIHVRRILLRRKAGIAVMIVCFCLAVGTVKPQFLTLGSLRIVLLLVPLIIGVFVGSQLVIVAGHVDLSIGSIMGPPCAGSPAGFGSRLCEAMRQAFGLLGVSRHRGAVSARRHDGQASAAKSGRA